MQLTEGYRFVSVGRHLRLHVVVIITTYLCLDKIHLAIPLRMTWIV